MAVLEAASRSMQPVTVTELSWNTARRAESAAPEMATSASVCNTVFIRIDEPPWLVPDNEDQIHAAAIGAARCVGLERAAGDARDESQQPVDSILQRHHANLAVSELLSQAEQDPRAELAPDHHGAGGVLGGCLDFKYIEVERAPDRTRERGSDRAGGHRGGALAEVHLLGGAQRAHGLVEDDQREDVAFFERGPARERELGCARAAAEVDLGRDAGDLACRIDVDDGIGKRPAAREAEIAAAFDLEPAALERVRALDDLECAAHADFGARCLRHVERPARDDVHVSKAEAAAGDPEIPPAKYEVVRQVDLDVDVSLLPRRLHADRGRFRSGRPLCRRRVRPRDRLLEQV